MLTIGICNENMQICKKLEDIIVSVLFDECECRTVLYNNLYDMLKALYGRDSEFNFLFVPIDCDGDSGLAFASEIRQKKVPCEIVFVSDNLRNVLDGYVYHAFDYFVYPISATRVKNMFDRYFLENDRSGNFFYIKNRQNIERVDKYLIYYFVSEGRKVNMISSGNPLPFYSKLDEVEEKINLGDKIFVRTHQSYLVNVQYIKTLTRDNIVMDNGDYIPVSRKYQAEVNKRLLDYLGGK